MDRLCGEDFIRIWEVGLEQHPVDRALTILAIALSNRSRQELALLSVGHRDALLFDVREQTFGPHLNSLAECPACAEQMEFSLNTAEIRLAAPLDHPEEIRWLNANEYEVAYHLPNSLDLAAVTGCQDVAAARDLLTRRCILRINQVQGKAGVAVAALPEAVLAALAAHMAEHDPQTTLELNLTCPTCSHCWPLLFDIASFFWTEICLQAKHLLREVDILARAYGWNETDILSLSSIRRQFYLELVLQ